MDVGSIGVGWLVCAACGEDIRHTDNHHCDEKFERRRQAIDRREQEPQNHGFTEAQRLNYGLFISECEGV